MKRRVVITGLGAISPLGLDAPSSWQAACDGVNGIAPITLYDTAEQRVKLACEVKNFSIEDYMDRRESRKMDRFTQFAVLASDQAMADSGLKPDGESAWRCGVIFSSGIGGLNTIQTECLKGEERGYDKVSPLFIPMSITNMAAGQIAIRHGLHGMCSCAVTACAGGTNAIGDAFRHIRDGYADAMLAGGTEAAINPFGMGGFTSMRALTTSQDPARACAPFDAQRSGFVMGEGAAVLVLESLEHALARGAKVYGEVVGYGASCDAHHITAPAPGGAGNAESLRQALADASLAPQDIDYINAHGTSTPTNDSIETAAIKTAFGAHAHALAVSSTKSMTGHMLGAAGAIEALFCLLALRDGFIPPTINYEVPDAECDLDYVPNRGRRAELRYALSNSLGFGGHNASLIFKKWEG